MNIKPSPISLVSAPKVLIFLAVCCVCLAACVPASLYAAAPNAAPPAGLTVAVPQGMTAQAMKAAATAYPATGVEATGGQAVRVVTFSSDAYANQIAAALLAGLDRYDLVYLPAESLPKWASYHALQPLMGDADRQANQPWLAAVTMDGKLYGLPTQPDPLVLFYRADLLQAKNLPIPRDWDAFRQAALALNAPPERFGAAIAGGDLNSSAAFAALLAGFGVQPVSDQYQVALDGPTAQRALTFYAGLRNTDKVVASGADSYGQAEVIAALKDGKAALGLGPLSAAGDLQDCKANPKLCKAGKPLLAWAWLPGVAETDGLGDLSAWAVPLHSARGPAAARFAAWLTGADGAQVWAKNGGIPAHQGVLAGLPAAGLTAAGDTKVVVSGAAALAKLRTYRLAYPPVTTVDQLWKADTTAVHAAVSGAQTPQQALKQAAAQMRQALRQGGYTEP